jgi:hypothetical protein
MTGQVIHIPGITGEMMDEKTVLAQWPCLSHEGLLIARKRGIIGWVRGKRGKPFYRPEAIRAYIKDVLENPCHAPAQGQSLKSAATGSPQSPSVRASTLSGLTQEMVERAGEASARRILNKPN